ncbi:MAG: ribonuclease III domain-containing protein [Promethearchaeota archaeon]
MRESKVNKIILFQELIEYQFQDETLLKAALTTPKLSNKMSIPHYEPLEFLGDPVLKLILSLKLYNENFRDPGELTKKKQQIENDKILSKIARSCFKLENFIFKTPDEDLENSTILADVLEAICGAIFLDSNYNLRIVEEKIVDKFYNDLPKLIDESPIFNKNLLLEYLQKSLRFTPKIELEFEKTGPDHALKWRGKHPRILDPKGNVIRNFSGLVSSYFKSKKDAEFEISSKILELLKKES